MTEDPDRRADKAGLGPASVRVAPSRRKWLPWLLIPLALIVLLLLARSCNRHDDDANTTTTTTTTSTTAPVGAAPGSPPPMAGMYGELQQYLASAQPAGRRFVFDNLHFATGSAQLPSDAAQTLGGLSQLLAAYPRARVQIVGYADARGPDPANARLGADRAEATARELVAQGVAADRVTTASGSESNPVAPNTTAQGQAENRRTELVVTAK